MLIPACTALAADDGEYPAVEFSQPPPVTPGPVQPKPVPPDLGLLIEGELATRNRLGQLIPGSDTSERILYEDDHHRVIGNPARPMLKMMYRYEAGSSEWRYDGSVVRGHVPRGSHFGWSVAVSKPYMAIMDWSSQPIVATLIVYEKTPNSLRGWKKRYEVVADDVQKARCMGGLDASKWLTIWQKDRGEACGATTLDGSQATRSAIRDSRR